MGYDICLSLNGFGRCNGKQISEKFGRKSRLHDEVWLDRYVFSASFLCTNWKHQNIPLCYKLWMTFATMCYTHCMWSMRRFRYDVHPMCALHIGAQSMSCSLYLSHSHSRNSFKSGECRDSATHECVFMLYFARFLLLIRFLRVSLVKRLFTAHLLQFDDSHSGYRIYID